MQPWLASPKGSSSIPTIRQWRAPLKLAEWILSHPIPLSHQAATSQGRAPEAARRHRGRGRRRRHPRRGRLTVRSDMQAASEWGQGIPLYFSVHQGREHSGHPLGPAQPIGAGGRRAPSCALSIQLLWRRAPAHTCTAAASCNQPVRRRACPGTYGVHPSGCAASCLCLLWQPVQPPRKVGPSVLCAAAPR
jgi:hypothetical protein